MWWAMVSNTFHIVTICKTVQEWDEATQSVVEHEVDVPVQLAHWGGQARLYRIDPPMDGSEHIVVCDRTPLAGATPFNLPGLPPQVNANDLRHTIDVPIKVFAVNDAGAPIGEELIALRQLISLRRYSEGIDFAEVLARLGYTLTDTSTPEEP
jgi:hypothetical protein